MMQAFEYAALAQARAATGGPWLEFLRVSSLSMGLYELAAGAADEQSPHSEDEVYYVVRGRGVIRVVNENRPVQAGSIIFVAANAQHHFHSITEDLSLLVVFAPAEYSNQ
jgi:mannose-6-phosphate isomerase-like protein (cupin superfamily)